MKSYELAQDFGENETFCRNNPSVKIGSVEPILTAPFTQGCARRRVQSATAVGGS